MSGQTIRLTNKYGTEVGVTDDNKLEVSATLATNTAVRTATLLRVTASTSSVAAGARSVSFFNAGGIDITSVAGAVLKPGESVTFTAGGEDDTLSAIAYTATGATDLLISTII